MATELVERSLEKFNLNDLRRLASIANAVRSVDEVQPGTLTERNSDQPVLIKLSPARMPNNELSPEHREAPFPRRRLLVDDSSRISRDIADAIRVMQTLKFLGVRVIYLSQGIDSDSDQADALVTPPRPHRLALSEGARQEDHAWVSG